MQRKPGGLLDAGAEQFPPELVQLLLALKFLARFLTLVNSLLTNLSFSFLKAISQLLDTEHTLCLQRSGFPKIVINIIKLM